VEVQVYNIKGKIIDYIKNEYNDDGKIILQKFMPGETKTFDYQANKIIEHNFSANDVEVRTIETTFDDNGNIIEEMSQSGQIMYQNQIIKYEYEYY
jgi:hypothetical protein